jgi:D-lactate dehydrogenase (cytochrome)
MDSDASSSAPELSDASNLRGGFADSIKYPSSAGQVSEILRESYYEDLPVTVSGGGTGIVGGRVPFGGVVLSTRALNRISGIEKQSDGTGVGRAEAGVVLRDFSRAVTSEGLFYPPDPTEWSCFIGGTIATNASGARTFRYGPTRNYVNGLRLALSNGDLFEIKRGEFFAGWDGGFSLPVCERVISGRIPGYSMPATRKNAAGYFCRPGMDLIDLFIGSEGTLAVVIEAELKLLPAPAEILGGIVFFAQDEQLLDLVARLRDSANTNKNSPIRPISIEYFDGNSLNFLRSKFDSIPVNAAGAVFFEQEIESNDDETMEAWYSLLESSGALLDESWFAENESDRARLKEFRHALPVLVNEWLTRHGQKKISTDMAVPDSEFAAMFEFYKSELQQSGLKSVTFGHIGDNHLHVNILPADDAESAKARKLYSTFIHRAVAAGGTVSAEHGIGKLKREYLMVQFGENGIREMAALKRLFDPKGILGRGNMIPEEFL